MQTTAPPSETGTETPSAAASTRAETVLAWQAVASASGPTETAERERAEAGVRTAYTTAGLAPPERIVWVPSPAHGAIAAALIDGHEDALREAGLGEHIASVAPLIDIPDRGGSVRESVRTLPWDRARAAICSELGPEQWAQVWTETVGRLWSQVDGITAWIRRAIGALAGDHPAVATTLRGATLDAVLGQHDAPWLSLIDALGHLGTPGHPGAALAGMAEVARTAGWWWPYERLAIVSERPVELHQDDQNRLHRGDGPALVYGDGFALHAWHGTPLPQEFVESLADLNPERIRAESNIELRRIMLEIFGYDRYLAETGAKPVNRSEFGTLWRIVLPNDEPILMVEVTNSTPEPDGTYRTYFLRVPPRTLTAREGVAWTFGLDAREYAPEKQT